MEESTAGSVEKFIQQSYELMPLLSEESGDRESGDGWEDNPASGQELSDYRPDPNVAIPLPPPPPLFPGHDTGQTPNALLEKRPPTPKDLEALDAEKGVCGLLNMGNTCYMNAGLQCIRNLPEIAKYYLDSRIQTPQVVSSSEPDKHTTCRGHLSARFGTLVQKLWSGRFSALHPKAFKTTLGLLHSQFSDNRQQDCHEFLAMLLDTLHEDAVSRNNLDGLPNGNCGEKAESKDKEEEEEEEEEEGKRGEVMETGETCSEEAKPSCEAEPTSSDCSNERKPTPNESSIITDTFQGMLRNEVVCSTCNHESTKMEPFVYLSVSLPHANERQFEICWVPLHSVQGTRRVMKVLVTVMKHLTVKEVKGALVGTLEMVLPQELIILAEVKWGSILRVLSDTFPLKNIDSANSSLYAFEMAPLGETAPPGETASLGPTATIEVVPNHESNSQKLALDATPPNPQSMGYMLLTNGGEVSSNTSQPPKGPADSNRVVLGVSEMLHDPWMPSMGSAPSQNVDSGNGSNLDVFGSKVFVPDHVNTPGGKHSKESDSETETLPAKMMRGDNDYDSSPMEAVTQSAPEAMECDSSTTYQPTGACAADSYEVAPEEITNPVAPHPSPTAQAVVMEWHSCSICLEEMVDSDLLTHKECGAIVCPSCLQASSEHYNKEQSLVPCPICSTLVNPSKAFSPLATQDNSQTVIRLLQTNILFRTESDNGSHYLFAHPAILNLPSSEQSTFYYSAIAPLLPLATVSHDWSLCLTDSRGRHCSRCLYSSGCHGCVIANYNEIPLELKPGDHIAVTFSPLPAMTVETAGRVERHASLAQKRENRLTLQECLENFSRRELLGSDNPWYCPQCREMQAAVRTLSVCSLPRTLIIHLKRFIYHGSAGSKVDASVVFPLELDPRCVCKENSSTQELELTAFVCHFGTLNTGHYTAYCKHPLTHEWRYYNDESVTKLAPSPRDAENAYVLFYQQSDSSSPSLPEIESTFDDTAELKCVEQLLRVFKPLPSSSSPSRPLPPLPVKKSSSETDLTVVGSETSAAAQTSSVLTALGLDPTPLGLPTSTATNRPLRRSSSNPRMALSKGLPPLGHSQKKGSLLEDYNNYDFMLEGDTGGRLTGGIQLLSAKATEW